VTKLRTGEPWMPAPDYGRSLEGLTINLLVQDIASALPFYREVLAAKLVYSDPDIAVLRFDQVEWMLHADHTYDQHPLSQILRETPPRGVGAELHLHGRDPDEAERAARKLGFRVLAPTADKPHGLREVHLLDADGYHWVPDVPIAP